jgi:hypothetical protein
MLGAITGGRANRVDAAYGSVGGGRENSVTGQ